MGLIIHLACVFDWSWTFWQWFIGIGGGLLLVIVLGLIVGLFNENVVVDYYVLGTIILGLCILFNFILVLICKGNYKIIFGCFSVFELICGLSLIFSTYSDLEEEWCAFQIVETIATLILFIVCLVCF